MLAEYLGGRRLSGLPLVLLLAVVALLLVAGGALVHGTGGTQHSWLHTLYVPVLLAAWALGPVGGAAAGVAAGLVVGPAMPLDVDAGIAQPFTNWAYRLASFTLLGAVGGGLSQLLRQQLRKAEQARQRFEALVEHAPDVIIVADADGIVSYASPSVEVVLGSAPGELHGTRLVDLLHAEDRDLVAGFVAQQDTDPSLERVEVRARHRDGSWRTLEVAVRNLLAVDAVSGVVYNARDVTEGRAMRARVRQLARYDHSTGLLNRRQFIDEVHASVNEFPDRQGGGLAVVLLELNRFDAVSRALGPETGEQLAVALARRLAATTRAEDVLARWSTTQFAVLSRRVGDQGAAVDLAHRLLTSVREPFLLVTGEIDLGGSAGAVFVDEPGPDPAGLLHNAYVALRHAQKSGANECALYQPSWDHYAAEALHSLRTEHDIFQAVEHDQFELHYQPIIDMDTRRVVALEALLRWQHPESGLISPSDFIPIAESTGAIVPIGEWALHRACAQLARWRSELEQPDLGISVNVSPRQLSATAFPRTVESALAKAGLPPNALTVEVTETAVVDDSARRVLEVIRSKGVRIAVDDFGTGYSSLGSLHRLPIDVLKIDRQFIRELEEGKSDEIVTAVIDLAQKLGLATVAEGVETPVQAARLRALGCRQLQGFLYAPPQSASDVPQYLARAITTD